MNYCFSVTKAGTPETLISNISPFDYNQVWKLWFRDFHLVLLYKFKHEFGDDGHKHLHYHGCMFSPKRMLYKDLDIPGFSVRIENPYKVNYDCWHEYCMHELKATLKDVQATKDELHGLKLLNSAIEAGSTYRIPKQTKIKIKKINALYKISITGSI